LAGAKLAASVLAVSRKVGDSQKSLLQRFVRLNLIAIKIAELPISNAYKFTFIAKKEEID